MANLFLKCGAPQSRDSFEFYATEHFRMSGVYWGLTAMHLLGRLDDMDGAEILAWVLSCAKPDGGFGGSERHDSHLLYTLSAVQILVLYNALDRVDTEQIVQCALCALDFHDSLTQLVRPVVTVPLLLAGLDLSSLSSMC